jgi:hypothetical protein
MVYDSRRNVIVLFSANYSNVGTWEWDGVGWDQFAAVGPSARAGHAMAYDAERKRTILFGGSNDSGLFGDTWSFDGEKWLLISETGPSPRVDHAMTFESLRRVVMLYGGVVAEDGDAENIWEWDGSAWSSRVSGGPGPRVAHTIVYDDVGDRTVLFGGQNDDGRRMGDTWELVPGPVRADADADCDVDLADLASFQRCFGGDASPAACMTFDLDGDAKVTLLDLIGLSSETTGPTGTALAN